MLSSLGSVLVTGGAGYIGSHTAWALLDAGWQVDVVDNLSTGKRHMVPPECNFIRGNVGDRAFFGNVLKSKPYAAVIHFAASLIVSESVSQPLTYFRNNVANSTALIAACAENEVPHLVFSSTAAVYGIPDAVPVTEEFDTDPINPYGLSKLMIERVLADAAASSSLRYVALRYFNVAGADPLGRCGQVLDNATNLTKVVCEVATGQREFMAVNGDDYDTPDGTCVRDYIHVSDLAQAHVDALKYLKAESQSQIINVGYGSGYSVQEVITAMERHVNSKLDVRSGPRREGDPPSVIASNVKAKTLLAWEPKHDDLDVILSSALAWERRLAEEKVS